MSEKTFISYEIKQDKKQGIVEIKVAIEAQATSRDSNAAVPWQKFKTSNARAVLAGKGYDVGAVVQESSMLVNADGPAMGTWIFADNNHVESPPVQKKRSSRNSTKTKRG